MITSQKSNPTRPVCDNMKNSEDTFALYFDCDLTLASPYDFRGKYYKRAKDRIDRTFLKVEGKIKNARVLDIGASPFYFLFLALKAGASRCTGVYFANDEHPAKNFKTLHSQIGSIEIEHCNIESGQLPFGADSFDMICASEVLEHLDYFPDNFLSEACRLLVPGGLLYITVPNAASIANILRLVFQKNIYHPYRSDASARHKHEYTMSELRSLINYAGMSIVDIGFMPDATSRRKFLKPVYRMISLLPFLKMYSPIVYVIAKQGREVPSIDRHRPRDLYIEDKAIEI